MNQKTDFKRTTVLSKIAFGVATAGFIVTWAQPAGPLVAVPFALLAMWLRIQASRETEPEPAPFTTHHEP